MSKLSYDYVKGFIESNGYKLLSNEYINAHAKLYIQCNEGHTYQANFNNFRSGKRCPICANNKRNINRRFSYDYVKGFIESNGYRLLSTEYINNNEKLDLICDKGHRISMSFKHFKAGHRCPICAGTAKFSYEYVRDYIASFGYTLLSTEYINVYQKLDVMCDKGHAYQVNFHNFRTGYRCPICNESKGERAISNILNKYGIDYIRQYRFDNCKIVFPLPFDFYLPEYDLLIEYDGKQHFEPIEVFGGIEYFKTVKNHDQMKNMYCGLANKKLLRIPYFNNDIENTIINFLNVEKLSTTIP